MFLPSVNHDTDRAKRNFIKKISLIVLLLHNMRSKLLADNSTKIK